MTAKKAKHIALFNMTTYQDQFMPSDIEVSNSRSSDDEEKNMKKSQKKGNNPK